MFLSSLEALQQNAVFGIQGIGSIYNNIAVTGTLTITESAGIVTVTIPSLTFPLVDSTCLLVPPQIYNLTPRLPFVLGGGTGGYGSVYLKSGFIPQQYRPASLIGVSQSVATTPTTGYDAIITQEGNIRFAVPILSSSSQLMGYQPYVGSGSVTTPQVTITYPVLPAMPASPTPIILSQGWTQEAYCQAQLELNQYLDLYFSDIYNDTIATFWTDNSLGSAPPFQSYGYVRTGTVSANGSVSLGTTQVVFFPPTGYYCSQGGISINPTNPNNMIANCLFLGGTTGLQLWVGVTTNGGTSWSTKQIDTGSIPPNASGDNNALFDIYGNYWLTNVATVNGKQTLTMLLSSDGGTTFSVAAEFNASTYITNGNYFDFNQMTFGSDGSTGHALYFASDLIVTGTLTETPSIGYIPVTGLGTYGTPTMVPITNYAINGVFGSPAVTNNGTLYLNYYGTVRDVTYGYYYLITINNGISGINSQAISNWQLWATNNLSVPVAASPGPETAYTSTNAKATRGMLPPFPVRTLAYDNTKGALYAIMCNPDPVYSQNCSLYLAASTNGGSTWSAPYYIKKYALGNCLQPSISIDSISGNVFITWYDSVSDPTANQYVQYMGAIITPTVLAEIIATIP